MITTNKAPSVHLHTFIADLMAVFPNSAYYKRGTFELKKICAMASERGFTDMMVINENKKTANGVVLIHLPGGPTAHFKAFHLVTLKSLRAESLCSYLALFWPRMSSIMHARLTINQS